MMLTTLSQRLVARTVVRTLSTFSRPPPNRFQQNREQEQRTTEHIPLRTKAISIFHADYDDLDGTETPQLYQDAEMDEEYEEDQDEETTIEDVYDKRKDNLASSLIQEEEERAQRKLRKIALCTAPTRVSQIDERGRSYGRGGRKTSAARVWIQPGVGEVVVNRLSMEEYFKNLGNREHILEPFIVTKTCGKFDVMAWVEGGGTTGQSGAIRHGIARALNHYNPDLYRAPLKVFGLLTRDARKVERKKIGLLKARKAPQWVKR